MIASINPATNELRRRFDELTDGELEQKLALAASTLLVWRDTSFAHRAERMARAAGILENEAGDFGRLMTLEMGKTLKSAADEGRKCAWACRYYAENAERFLADEP